MAKKVKSLLTSDLFRKPIFWLGLITLLGGFFRFYTPNWDFQHSFHPDERNILGAIGELRADNGFKVRFFAYGQLPVYLYRATGELISTPQFWANSFHDSPHAAQFTYWIFLIALFAGIVWGFSREEWRNYSFGASVALFILALYLKFFDVFTAWFGALEGLQGSLGFLSFIHNPPPTLPVLSLACFFAVGVASMGLSAIAANLLEIEWVDIPFYVACGATFLFGVVPSFLPESFHLSRTFAAMAFFLLVATAGIWLAQVSRWGRVLLAFLATWTFFASLNHGWPSYTGNGDMMIVGRTWAAVFSTSTIVALYFLVKRIYQNTSMALMAATGFAFAAVSIEQAHYCITESFITLMFVVVALCSYEILKQGTWKSYLWAGAAFGLAMAAKTSALYYVFMLVTAHLVLLSQKSAKDWEKEGKKLRENLGLYNVLAGGLLGGILLAFLMVGIQLHGVIRDLFDKNQGMIAPIWGLLFIILAALGVLFFAWGIKEFKVFRAQMPQWIKLIGAGGLSFFVFFLLCPWSLLDLQGYLGSMGYEWSVVSNADACYVFQFKDTPRYLYHLANLMHVELWWPLGVTAVLGMVWVLGRFFGGLANPVGKGSLLPLPFSRTKGFAFSLPDLLILCWFIPYFGFIGSWNTKFVRYMVPTIPAFCIFAARFLTDLFQWLKSKVSFGPWVRKAVLAVVFGGSLFYSLAYMHVYFYPNPWIDASVWIFKNVPQGSAIVNEVWGDGLPVDVSPQMDSRMDKSMGGGNYRNVDVSPYETFGTRTDDSPTKKNSYVDILQKGDYISISSKKLWYTLTQSTPEFKPTGFNIYPVTSRYYRLLWSGLLGFKMVAEIHNFPSFLGWEHPDDTAEESFSVYDHPRVYIFKKMETVPPEKIIKLLSSDDYVKGVTRDIMKDITPATVDAFIAQRHKYLEDHGLLAGLDVAAPVTDSTPSGRSPQAEGSAHSAPEAVLPEIAVHSKKRSKQGQAGVVAPEQVQVSPTPEIQVNAPSTVPGLPDAKTLQALKALADHPVTEMDLSNVSVAHEETVAYQLRAWFSWLFFLILLGWLALPLTLRVMDKIPAGAYSLSKILGFFVFAWVVWFSSFKFQSLHWSLCRFTIGTCWIWFLVLAALSGYAYWRDKKNIKVLYDKWGKSWLIQEGAFVLAFTLFSLVKIFISHIHDPVGEGYNGGGEAGMDFGFLASVFRSETFPPQNMWMAGLPISYTFYYGHLMMGILTKTLGLVPAVTYNLGLITLFALVFSGAFGLAYGLSGRLSSGWIAGALCAAAGNLAGAKQYLDVLHSCFASLSLAPLANHTYDFFGPSRIIPFGNGSGWTINEFPYFSVLYGDMHAHTLAMPFAMLVIGVLASFYLSQAAKPFDWKGDWPNLLAIGFLLGGIAFLNTWEVPTWLVLTGITLLVRALSGLNGKVLQKGLTTIFGCLVLSLTLLGWWIISRIWTGFKIDVNEQALGGATLYLAFFGLLGLVGAVLWLFSRKATKPFSLQIITIGLSLAGILAVMGFLWIPYFANFTPQQNKIMWVIPNIRTTVREYFSIYGLFLSVILLSFTGAFAREITLWVAKAKDEKNIWKVLPDKFSSLWDRLLSPKNAVQGMLSLGAGSLAVLWGASWAHWVEPPDKLIFSQLLATLTVGLFVTAVYLKNRMELWMATATAVLLWMAVLVLGGLKLIRDLPLTLDLGFFSLLWMTAFFFLGTAVKAFKDRALSFSYILVSFFFFVTATLEQFVMSEYFGFGDGMRNNSMFKYGINAWTLASVATGIFLPQVYEFLLNGLKAIKREAPPARRMLMILSGIILFVLLWEVLEAFFPFMQNSGIYTTNFVLLAAVLTWGLMEKWFKNNISKWIFIGVFVFLMLLPATAALSQGYGRLFSLIQQWSAEINAGILFPALLAFALVSLGGVMWENKKDLGRRMAFLSWQTLMAVFVLMVAVYPIASSVRKAHGFFTSLRQQWVGWAESPTLNGLEYIRKVNPEDAAAIRFLNEHVPDQPCLAEFVGEGYNSWGSRVSIFTGIPALMGWDGHVHEWVTGRPLLGADVDQRRQGNEMIFNTLDPAVAKKYLDAYGVRLVMVGTVERHGVPGRKGGYPEAGLAKFAGFLPLIYKNPQVEIYYNPPPAN